MFNNLGNADSNDEHKRIKFLPYHHPAIFDRTFNAARNGEGVICAILCATVLEAYLSDLMNFYGFLSKTPIKFYENDHPANNYLNDRERKLLCGLIEAENKRDGLRHRFCILGDWDKSEKTYQNFNTLIKIRNALVHLKPEEVVLCEDTAKFTGYPKFLNDFFQKKIIKKPQNFKSWIELIETQEFCLWCQNTVYRAIEKSNQMLPDTNVKTYFVEETYFPFDIDTWRNRYQKK